MRQYHRRSIRLQGYDYTRSGAYYVTICTHDRTCLFGEIVDGKMVLSRLGLAVREEWLNTARLRDRVELDEFVVMPNHFHGILWLRGDPGTAPVAGTAPEPKKGTARRAPTATGVAGTARRGHAENTERFGRPVPDSLPTVVRAFKSAVTKGINKMRGTPGGRVWQRDYYEHIIRNDRELHRIRQYIQHNPAKWDSDRENPASPRPMNPRGARRTAPGQPRTIWRR